MPAPERIPPRGGVNAEQLLATGELTVVGHIREASNAVLYATVSHGDESLPCVYKPTAGERPLWDFPDGTLARREVAAYAVCRALGWDLVPPTVLREGPYGAGMCQQWQGPLPDSPEPERTAADGLLALVDGPEPEPGWKAVGLVALDGDEGDGEPGEPGAERTALLVHADDARLRRVAVLDAVINNADRKGGHLLPQPDGRLYAIDHGVTFHTDDKLRTLLWGWAGEELPGEALTPLRGLAEELAAGAVLATRLAELLSAGELDALRKRTELLLSTGRHPLPGGAWPAIPWPPV
ncbi:SCO1664 family protein [Streptomyces sp. 549]|uniref:SCO1664 family protein n=1 Tax=Streptomyces sp. 549 TaxID=3049076 RepID=UPI0024C39AFB|nr:SCO1664 family protein [Streptomyces sp. 549]MDK1473554.1 SCO1664 family protein [Streptomyces sp. 549]